MSKKNKNVKANQPVEETQIVETLQTLENVEIQNVENVEIQNVEIEVFKPVMTVCGTIKLLGAQGAKSRAELANKVFNYLKERGQTRHCRGEIDEVRVKHEISAIVRDIKGTLKNGFTPRKGWWSTYDVEETNEVFRIFPKPAL